MSNNHKNNGKLSTSQDVHNCLHYPSVPSTPPNVARYRTSHIYPTGKKTVLPGAYDLSASLPSPNYRYGVIPSKAPKRVAGDNIITHGPFNLRGRTSDVRPNSTRPDPTRMTNGPREGQGTPKSSLRGYLTDKNEMHYKRDKLEPLGKTVIRDGCLFSFLDLFFFVFGRTSIDRLRAVAQQKT